MEILPITEIKIALSKIKEIENIMQATFRRVTFSRQYKAGNLLNAYLSSTAGLKNSLYGH
jgi:hypothetical protein